MYQEVQLGKEHVLIQNSCPCEVHNKHCPEQVESMCIQGLDYRHGMMTEFCSIKASLAVASDDLIVEEVDDREVAKDACFVVIWDVAYRSEAMCKLRVNVGDAWTEGTLRMQQIMRQSDEEVEQVEAIKLSKTSNTTTSIVHIDKAFVDILKGSISCPNALEL